MMRLELWDQYGVPLKVIEYYCAPPELVMPVAHVAGISITELLDGAIPPAPTFTSRRFRADHHDGERTVIYREIA